MEASDRYDAAALAERLAPDAAFKLLGAACTSSNASDAHTQLFLWGSAKFSQIECIQDLKQIASSEAFTLALDNLESALYSPAADTNWQGAELLKAVTRLNKTRETKDRKSALLDTLNPV